MERKSEKSQPFLFFSLSQETNSFLIIMCETLTMRIINSANAPSLIFSGVNLIKFIFFNRELICDLRQLLDVLILNLKGKLNRANGIRNSYGILMPLIPSAIVTSDEIQLEAVVSIPEGIHD